jgi:hypothetical protein
MGNQNGAGYFRSVGMESCRSGRSVFFYRCSDHCSATRFMYSPFGVVKRSVVRCGMGDRKLTKAMQAVIDQVHKTDSRGNNRGLFRY